MRAKKGFSTASTPKLTGSPLAGAPSTAPAAQQLTAKNIVIATGSESSPLNGVTIDEKTVVTSTAMIDQAKLHSLIADLEAAARGD